MKSIYNIYILMIKKVVTSSGDFIPSLGELSSKLPGSVEAGDQDAESNKQLEAALLVEGQLPVRPPPDNVEDGDDDNEDVDDGVLDGVPIRTVHFIEPPQSCWDFR